MLRTLCLSLLLCTIPACRSPFATDEGDMPLRPAPTDVAGRLSADVDTLLAAVGVAYIESVSIPGDELELRVDSPVVKDARVELSTYGMCEVDALALKGGLFRKMQNRRACLFGPVKATVFSERRQVMTVYMRVSAAPASLDWSQPTTATAVVGEARYRLDADHDSWQVVED